MHASLFVIVLILIFLDLELPFRRVIYPIRPMARSDAGHYRWLILTDDAAAVLGGGDDGAGAPQIGSERVLHPHTPDNNYINVSLQVYARR